MSKKIEGDFDEAIRSVIALLVSGSLGNHTQVDVQTFSKGVLSVWDKTRGTDWYLLTNKWKESNEKE